MALEDGGDVKRRRRREKVNVYEKSLGGEKMGSPPVRIEYIVILPPHQGWEF